MITLAFEGKILCYVPTDGLTLDQLSTIRRHWAETLEVSQYELDLSFTKEV